jgi:Flp pilus assembly pilin Flp
MVEYGLMVALVALMAFSAVQMLGHRTEDSFTTAAEALDEGTTAGGDGSVAAAPSSNDDTSSGGGSEDTQGSPTTTTPTTAPSDTFGEQGGGGTTTTTLPPTTTTTAPAPTTTTTQPTPTTAAVTGTASSFTWWNPDKHGGEGAWKASVSFNNDTNRHQYLTLQVVQVNDKGTTTTITVNDFYVPANGKSTFDQWDNAYSLTNGKEKGIVSVSVKVVSVRTSDANWQTLTYQTPNSTPTVVNVPKV